MVKTGFNLVNLSYKHFRDQRYRRYATIYLYSVLTGF